MEHINEPDNEDHETENMEPIKVVLADDDIDDQEFFRNALIKTNIPIELTKVDNGVELINYLNDPAESNPDIIFLDINMPLKNGIEALTEIKTDETLKEIPIVMLSTSSHLKDVEETFTAGANLYVQKPGSFNSLIILLKKVFKLKWAGALLRPLRKTFFMSDKNISDGPV